MIELRNGYKLISQTVVRILCGLTHLDCFFPIPVAMEVVQRFVSMTSILLLRATSSLISFYPSCLNTLPACASNTRSVVERISVHAIVFVITDMHLWNAANNTLSDRNEIRPPFGKASNTINTVLAFDIVTV